jgi:AcrR family transcriptional regulator
MASNPGLSQQRRDQNLDAAASVFARMGVHDARIDEIVAEAALSKGAVY